MRYSPRSRSRRAVCFWIVRSRDASRSRACDSLPSRTGEPAGLRHLPGARARARDRAQLLGEDAGLLVRLLGLPTEPAELAVDARLVRPRVARRHPRREHRRDQSGGSGAHEAGTTPHQSARPSAACPCREPVERAQRLLPAGAGRRRSGSPDLKAGGPVIGLELLERGERAIPLLLGLEQLSLAAVELVQRIRAGAAHGGRQCDHDDDRDGERRREQEPAAHVVAGVSERSSACVPRRKAPLLTRVRPERDQRAQHEHDPREPDEVDERLDEHAEDDGAVVAHLLGDDEEILAGEEVGADPDLVRHLLLDAVRILARRDRSQIVAPASDVEDGTDLRRVRAVALPELSVGQRVAADGERVAAAASFGDRVVRARARDPDGEQHDGRVDDVAAVPPPVPTDELRERRGHGLAGERAPRAVPRANSTTIAASTKAENVYAISPGIDDPAPSTTSTCRLQGRRPRATRRRTSPRSEARRHATRGRSPSAGAAGARRSAGRSRVRPADDDRLAAHRLGDHRPPSPQDRQAERDEEQVVVEERRLARDERLELAVVGAAGVAARSSRSRTRRRR